MTTTSALAAVIAHHGPRRRGTVGGSAAVIVDIHAARGVPRRTLVAAAAWRAPVLVRAIATVVVAIVPVAAVVDVALGTGDATHAVRHVVADGPAAVVVAGPVPDAAVISPVRPVAVEHRVVVVRDDLHAGGDVRHRWRGVVATAAAVDGD